MDKLLKKDSKFFEITFYGLKLEFELFNIEYIWNKLIVLEQKQIICSTNRLQIPNPKPFGSFKTLYTDENGKEKYHYFAYIKFFVFENQKYGLVGGKTNYPSPDISFDFKKDKKDYRIARAFLNNNNYQWSNEIIIVNHEPFLDNKEKDEQQALFLETYLQRQFNLLDS